MNDELFEDVACPLCGARDYNVVYPPLYPLDVKEGELLKIYRSSGDQELLDQLVRCCHCTMKYVTPRVRRDILLKSYEDAEDEVFVRQNSFRLKTFSKSLRKIKRFFAFDDQKGIQYLDVGCASGVCVKAARDLGFDAIGVEPSKWMCEYGEKEYGLDLRQGTLEEQHFEDGFFDIVSMYDVIEHVPTPSDTLKEIYRILKPSGKLVVNVPDSGSIISRIMGKKWPFLLNVHIHYYTSSTIKKQLEKAGFEVKYIRPYWQILPLGYIFERAACYFSFFRILKRFVGMIKISDCPIRYYLGQKLVLASKKP